MAELTQISEHATERQVSDDAPARPDEGLRRSVLGLLNVVVQGVTHIGPAIGIVLFIPIVEGYAGLATPFAYLLATVMMLLVALVHIQLARYLPSSGGYYTYLSRTVHPRAGFMTGWTMFIFELSQPAGAFAYGGYIVQTTLQSNYGIDIPWWVFFLVGAIGLFAISYNGIQISVRIAAVLCGLEMAIVTAIALSGLFSPGPGGLTLSPFNPGSAPSGNGLYLGVLFSILAVAGWESTAPLAEESANPRRTVPRAMLLAIAITSVFFLVNSWAIIVGWGAAKLGSFAGAAGSPVFVLAHRLWGGAWIVVFVAVVNGIVGIAIAGQNAATRVLYRMARTGVLPSALATAHQKHRTPVGATCLQTAITLAFGLGLGFWIGPLKVFVCLGLGGTIGYILIYVAGNLGAIRHYLRERRSEFNVLRHGLLPLAVSAALLWVGYKSVIPLPLPPASYAPIAVGVWLGFGLLILAVVHYRGRERWLLEAGREIELGAEGPPASPKQRLGAELDPTRSFC